LLALGKICFLNLPERPIRPNIPAEPYPSLIHPQAPARVVPLSNAAVTPHRASLPRPRRRASQQRGPPPLLSGESNSGALPPRPARSAAVASSPAVGKVPFPRGRAAVGKRVSTLLSDRLAAASLPSLSSRRVIYVGAIKKDVSYLHAIKKFGDTSMP
jgi:hypothetical protein